MFLVDTVSWIDFVLTNAGEYGVLSTSQSVASSSHKLVNKKQEVETNPAIENNEFQYISGLNAINQNAIRKFIPDSEGRTLVVENEKSVEVVSSVPRYTFGALAAIWGVTALSGTAPLSLLIGGPLLGAGCRSLSAAC